MRYLLILNDHDIFKYGEGKKHMGRPRDEAWDMVDCLYSNGWECRHCLKSYTSCSGVTRVKHHLAQMPGGGIGPCPNVPRDVRKRARQLLQAKATAVTARNNGKNLILIVTFPPLIKC